MRAAPQGSIFVEFSPINGQSLLAGL